MRELKALVLTPLRGAKHIRDIIERGLLDAQVSPVFVDQLNIPSGTHQHNVITDSIQESDIIVADVTDNNPNVLYELGYTHALRKPTVLLVNVASADYISQDLAGFQIIAYEPGSLDSLASRISRIVNSHAKRLSVVL